MTVDQFHALELWILAACARNSAGSGAGPSNYTKRRNEAFAILTQSLGPAPPIPTTWPR